MRKKHLILFLILFSCNITNNNINTNAYYILQTNQLQTLNKTDNFRANPNSNRVGSTLTESSFALETFLAFAAGTSEYQVTNSTRGYDKGFEKVQPNTNYEPYKSVKQYKPFKSFKE